MTVPIAMLIIAVIILMFQADVDFVDPAEFQAIARRQPYFQHMTPADLLARSSAVPFETADRYLEWYCANTLEWSWYERIWMRAVVSDARRAMQRHGLTRYCPKWRFAKVSNLVEQGFPHTHADVIVWSEDTLREPFWEQVKLVIHEAVHIWQRQNPDATRADHRARGFQVTPRQLALRRNNPDTDLTVWQRDGEVFTTCYRNDHPNSLTDVTGEDHPNELMSYRIAELAMS